MSRELPPIDAPSTAARADRPSPVPEPAALPATLPRRRLTDAFERRVARALHRQVPTDAPLVVATSGGPDSTALLIALARVHAGPLTAACFDHRLRPPVEAGGDADFVGSLAALLEVGFMHGAAPDAPDAEPSGADRPDGGGPEARARTLRYRWLAAVCAQRGARTVACGHTLDDQAETVLLRLTRGTGIGGAGGMRPLAPWPLGAPQAQPTGAESLRVVRPLLDIERGEVHAYLHRLGVRARTDPSNASLDYDRNRIRRRVLPELADINPRVAPALARFAERAAADAAHLDAIAAAELDEMRIPQDRVANPAGGAATGAQIALERRALGALAEPIASRVVRLAAAELGLAPNAAQVSQLLRSLQRGGAQTAIRGGRIWIEGRSLHLAADR